MGYEGKSSILREFVSRHRPQNCSKATIRFETPPGKQAQCDWAYFGNLEVNGIKKKLYCFVMILGYSRCLYIEYTFSMDVHTLIRCQINAFRYFGGVPETILYDNTKTVTIGRDETFKPVWNTQLADFAAYYGYIPRVCWPNRPRTKGKVENSVGYIRNNFFSGTALTSLEELNRQAIAWLNTTANTRIHGTTKEIPFHRLKQEILLPLGTKPDYTTDHLETRKVTWDCHVSYKGNSYLVPFDYAGTPLPFRRKISFCISSIKAVSLV